MDPTHHNFIELLNGMDKLKWRSYSSHDSKRFSKTEIEKITGKYKTKVGQGAFGKVYSGTLEDGSVVAVKVFDHNDSKMRECLAKEIIVHSQINHRNVTRLIGFCMEEDALMMVTEYIPNGNLSDLLHQDVRPISLDTRLRIAMECAGALAYMHLQMYTHVIHGDIKPANILLSENFNAKISDFGISRLVNTDASLYTMHVIGSIGYIDPLFVRTGRLTPKSDVYSFGIVLLEMFTRKKIKTGNEGLSLVDGFIQGLSKGFRRVREMFDAEISDGNNSKILDGIAKLISECLSLEIVKRPEIANVAERLQALRKAHHQGQERVGLFSWGRKIKPDSAAENTIPVKTTAGQESMVDLELELKGLFWLGFQASDLGQGMFGHTYKVVLANGTVLAVKRVRPDLGEQDFTSRVAVISDVKSDLVMSLYWHHCSKSVRFLMYDYMPMGSLAALLHGENGSAGGQLNWERRSSIALTVARGVAAIHSTGSAASSCHGNIKSSNVFLTADHEARLSERGLHTLVDMSFSGQMGGYRAPEVAVIARDTTKQSDVYSFGVLLLELLTGKRPTTNMLLNEEGVNLPRWVQSISQKDWTSKVLDAGIRKQHRKYEAEMLLLLKLAMVCCAQLASERPAMSKVVQKIAGIRRFISVHWASPPAETSTYRSQKKVASEEGSNQTIPSSALTMADPVFMGRGTFGRTWKVVKMDMRDIMVATLTEDMVFPKAAFDQYIAATESIKKELVVKFLEDVELPEAEFDRRTAAIKAINCDLLVPLHGHYFRNGEKALVYSYMPMGSLSALLHGNGAYGRLKLRLEQRTTIALTVAHGLAAIHSAGPRACHGNIKSSNVLLTSGYEARLSEHGLYTLISMSSFVATTRVSGYLAPEVTTDTRVTKEADVYSFGILLIELLTAREPTDAPLSGKGLDLSRWVHSIAREDWMAKVFDAELVRQQGAAAERLEQLLHLAMDCCTSFSLRPEISEVVSRIVGFPRKERYKSTGNGLPERCDVDGKY
ncbi:unnamed protein product [Urochloa humidicola]